MEKFSLKNPPIEQAAIEVIVDLPAGKNFTDLKRVKERLKPDYPKDLAMRQQAFEVKFEGEKAPKGTFEDLGEFGHQLWSEDQKQGLQIRMDGVLLTRNAPYENWENCFAQFEKALVAYFTELNPTKVRRISSRFINRLDLEVGKPFETFMKIPLPVPTNVSGVQVAHLASRVTFVDPKTGLTGTVIQMTAPSPGDATKFQCVLDIDVGRIEDMKADLDGIKAGFNEIRDYKNELFKQSITDELMKRYQ